MWGTIALREPLHLVGVLLGGHPKLPDGIWMISSPVKYLNSEQTLAITSSRGQLYELRKRFEGPWPQEAVDLIRQAMRKWGVKGEPPIAPIAWDNLPDEIAKRNLDADPLRDIQGATGQDQ
jgi:hypothetical protein